MFLQAMSEGKAGLLWLVLYQISSLEFTSMRRFVLVPIAIAFNWGFKSVALSLSKDMNRLNDSATKRQQTCCRRLCGFMVIMLASSYCVARKREREREWERLIRPRSWERCWCLIHNNEGANWGRWGRETRPVIQVRNKETVWRVTVLLYYCS